MNSKCLYEPVVTLEEDNIQKLPSFWTRYLGIFYAILSVLCLVTGDVIVRRLRDYHSSELIMYRATVEIVFLVPILIQQGIKFTFWSQAPLLILRGVLLAFNFFFRIYTVQSLSLTESQAILCSYPTVTIILSRIFLKNRFTNVKFAALAVNIVAIVLVCHFWTGFDLDRYLAIGSGMVFLVTRSTQLIILKILTLDMAPKLAVFHVTWMRVFFMLAVTEINNGLSVPDIPKCTDQWYISEAMLIILMGVILLAHATFDAEAVKLESVSTVSSIKTTTTLPLVIISQMVVFNDVPGVEVIVGILLVLVASLLINVDGIVDKLSPDSRLRRLVSKINNNRD